MRIAQRVALALAAAVVAAVPVRAASVGAGAPPSNLTAALLAPPPPPPSASGLFHLGGQKYGAPVGRRTEAGITWSLDRHVGVQLNYERTSQAPMMRFDHDDGFLTRLRFGF